ncbi:MAG: MoxR family ATPase [Xenococcaceae cyanobacterium MO_188.B29]|nr:MoxR family ATPase [Xenococcaceae cyanobacterium MO_188.B29]
MSNLKNLLKAHGKPFYTGNSISLEDSQGYKLSPYLPSPKLVDAVNLSIFLENRPLLLKGEPGCGKTRLAEAVALELGLPYQPWYIKSTTKAKDGLYTYDAVDRLYDVQLASMDKQSPQVKDLNNYIRKGPLGCAFENEKRTVVLIDEIDKADIDFPNDLLRELDEQKFKIEETGEEVEAKCPPIVFITSNDEKDLPDAFLRRCLFYYIEFPSDEQLKSIVNIHFPESPIDLVEAAVKRFTELRQKMQGKHDKKVSTSELLDWFAVLREFPQDEVLKQLQGQIPFPEILLKKWEDHQRYLSEK